MKAVQLAAHTAAEAFCKAASTMEARGLGAEFRVNSFRLCRMGGPVSGVRVLALSIDPRRRQA
jgi:hypothetical protein